MWNRSRMGKRGMSRSATSSPAVSTGGRMNVVRIERKGVELVAPLFDAYRVFYGQASDPTLAREYLDERLGNGQSVVFAAIDGPDAGTGANAIGFTQLYPLFSSVAARHTWLLNDLFVAPEARGQGVARALLERARKFAETSGAFKLVLATAPDNEAAQNLYESARWKRDPFFHYYLEV